MSEQKHKAVFTADNRDLLKKVDQTGNKMQSLSNKVKGLASGFIAAFSIKAVASFLTSSMKAYDEEAKASASLLVALKGRKDIQQDIISQAKELQSETLFADEQTIQAGARLAMILGTNADALKKLLPLVQDFATGKGMDLSSAADLIAKSIGSSTNSLTRYGIQIEGAAGSSARLEMAMIGLNKQVGGQARKAAETGLGPLRQLVNAFDDLKEVIGQAIVEGEGFQRMIKNIKTATEGTAEFFSEDLVTATGKPITGFKKLLTWFGLTQGSFKATEKVIQSYIYKQENLTEAVAGSTEVVKPAVKTIADYKQEIKDLEGELDTLTVGEWAHAGVIRNKIADLREYISGITEVRDIYRATTENLKMPQFSKKIFGEDVKKDLIDMKYNVGTVTESLTYAQIAAQSFSDQMIQAGIDSKGSMLDFARTAVAVAKKVIATYIAEGVAAAVKSALVKVPFPFNVIAAGIAGGLAAAAFNRLIPNFAEGGAAYGPTLAMVGEAPGISRANPEYIGTARQLSQSLGGRLTCRVSRNDLLFVLNEGQAASGRNY